MGFYGNITNTARTQFVFDRTYANRQEMDASCASDGIYAGRYVLVEYESEASEDRYRKNYFYVQWAPERDGGVGEKQMYTQMDTSHGSYGYAGPIEVSKVTIDSEGIDDGEIAKIDAGKMLLNVNPVPKYIRITNVQTWAYEFITEQEYLSYWSQPGRVLPDYDNDITALHAHLVNGVITNKNVATMPGGICLMVPVGCAYTPSSTDLYYMAVRDPARGLSWIQLSNDGTTFLKNFNIDIRRYGTSRGYDSTVWQKVYDNKTHTDKYVMIAELNSVVPTFDICADAPSLVPISPHFDAASTNVYYKFHWQPQWGIRTKAANKNLIGPEVNSNGTFNPLAQVNMTKDSVIYPSDQQTEWASTFYDATKDTMQKKYFNTVNRVWSDTNVQSETNRTLFDAAIYFNKAGFDPETIAYSADLLDSTKPNYNASILANRWKNEDKITFAPTGLSGNVYNSHNLTLDPTPQIDTQELSVMLPSLGDSVAKMWDLVYGGRDTNQQINKTSLRNTHIEWEDAAKAISRQGLRLVTNREDGNGFELTDIEANTIAGCINSVHDLMGMIIVDNAETITKPIGELDENAIYFKNSDGTFNRKGKAYSYTPIQYAYEPVTDVDEDTYIQHYYYLDATGTQVAHGDYDPSATYYRKIVAPIPENDPYQPIGLNEYQPGVYYHTPANEWKCEMSEAPSAGVKYYRFVSADQMELSNTYEPNTVYYKDNTNTTFILDGEENSTANRKYYRIDNVQPANLNMNDPGSYDTTTNLFMYNGEWQRLKYIYVPGVFFYPELNAQGDFTGNYIRENTPINELQWNADGSLSTDKQYLILDAVSQEEEETRYVQDENGNYVYQTFINGTVKVVHKYEIDLYKYEDNKFYKITERKDILDEYSQITSIASKYRLVTESEIISDYQDQFTTQENAILAYAQYYTLEAIEQASFYTADTFWYKTPENNYVKDKALQPTEGRVYYKDPINFTPINVTYYVPGGYYKWNAELGIYEIDTNLNFDHTQHFVKQDLYVTADGLHIFPVGSVWENREATIPAMVALGKQQVESVFIPMQGFARDKNTVHGLLLEINKKLENNIRETRDLTTVQGALNKLNDIIYSFGGIEPNRALLSDAYGRIHSAELNCDNWLSLKVQGHPEHSAYILKHKFTPVADTATTSNKAEVYSGADAGLNNTIDNVLKLKTPIVDVTGHVVGINTESVTLPKEKYQYTYNGTSNELTKEQLMAKIADLEARIAQLENPT